MSVPAHIQKTLVMKPEVKKIFDDLDEWLDHCRLNLIKFEPADLYSSMWKREQARKAKKETRSKKKQEE